MDTREQIAAAFNFRHACKAFDPDRPIAADDFASILEAGRLSPSSFGLEPWHFLVVQDRALRERLQAHAWGGQGQLPSASHVVLILARNGADTRHDSAYVDRILNEVKSLPPDVVVRMRDFLANFQQRDWRLLDGERPLRDWAARQCYIALANMMTAAALLGIDSCPMEGFDPAAMDALLHDAFAVDTRRFGLAVMVAFGHRVQEAPVKRRQRLEEIVTWHH